MLVRMRSLVSNRQRGAGEPQLAWTIASDIGEIDHIVRAVSDACASAGFSDKLCRLNVPVALTEALANAIERGNRSDLARCVRVRAWVCDTELCVEVTDEGEGFDTAVVRAMSDAPDWTEREDGRGVFLMYALMDQVETWCDAGHTVRLVLRRP